MFVEDLASDWGSSSLKKSCLALTGFSQTVLFCRLRRELGSDIESINLVNILIFGAAFVAPCLQPKPSKRRCHLHIYSLWLTAAWNT